MCSHSLLQLPIIHFSKENSESIYTEVRWALEEFGCFEAVYDKVSVELEKAICGLMEELFDLPEEVKSKNISSKPLFGYTANVPQYALYEGLGIDDATSFHATQKFTNLMWPQGKSNACEILHSYATKVSALEKMVMKIIFKSLGVEKFYKSHEDSISYLLKLTKYKVPKTDGTELGLLSHTDKSFFTILHQLNQVHGLEVETKNGEWIKATPSPSSLICMVGDGFYAWSNGRVHNPRHRVMMSGKEARYSISLFSFSSDLIQCPDEMVDEENPLLFKPFDQLEFIKFHISDEGRKAEFPLKTYSGVY